MPSLVDVVIPTRNRPDKLGNCLDALMRARERTPFEVYVCDSSDDERRPLVAEVCARFANVHLVSHQRVGYAAARNEAARAGNAPLVVSVDDDVYVYPDAIELLLSAYLREPGWSVVAGSVAWGEDWTAPVAMRAIGYGRKSEPGEQPSFLITALYLFPRELVRFVPYNERIRSSDDRWVGAAWKAKGVRMLYEGRAKAKHDDDHTTGLTTADHQDSHVYSNLFEAIWADRSVKRALQYDVLGFAAGARAHLRPGTATTYARAWWNGHRMLWRDRRWLSEIARTPLPQRLPEGLPPGLAR